MRGVFCLIVLFIIVISCNNIAENESKKHIEKGVSNDEMNKSVSMEHYHKLVTL